MCESRKRATDPEVEQVQLKGLCEESLVEEQTYIGTRRAVRAGKQVPWGQSGRQHKTQAAELGQISRTGLGQTGYRYRQLKPECSGARQP